MRGIRTVCAFWWGFAFSGFIMVIRTLSTTGRVSAPVVWPKPQHFVQWVGFLLNSITGKLLKASTILWGRCVANFTIQEAVLDSVLILDLKDSITPCSRRRADISSSVSEVGIPWTIPLISVSAFVFTTWITRFPTVMLFSSKRDNFWFSLVGWMKRSPREARRVDFTLSTFDSMSSMKDVKAENCSCLNVVCVSKSDIMTGKRAGLSPINAFLKSVWGALLASEKKALRCPCHVVIVGFEHLKIVGHIYDSTWYSIV